MSTEHDDDSPSGTYLRFRRERAPRVGRVPGKKGAYDEGSLDQYLRDISAYPLISREDEVELARRIREGDQEALDKLVRSNLRFVVSVAKKYQNQGVSLSDLINEGNLGLIRAAHKFDETKGIKFISYAVWWIRQAILQALAEQSRIVRVPLNRAGTLHRIGKRANMLLQELGREATHAEIADGMDITEEEVGGRTLNFEPARDSQLCGHQLSETTWTSRARYCAELKEPGKFVCAKHDEEYEPNVKWAAGNVRGLEAHEVGKADRVYASVADLSTDDTWELVARLLNGLSMRAEDLEVASRFIMSDAHRIRYDSPLSNWVHSRLR